MLPTLAHGQQVLVARFRVEPRIGDIVLALHPLREGFLIVKRIARVDAAGAFLLGDNPSATTDSRDFGSVPLERLVGRVVCTLT